MMTKEQFIDAIKRLNPFLEIDKSCGFVEYKARPDYSIYLNDEIITIEYYYCERDYNESTYRYDEIGSIDEIPYPFTMTPVDKFRMALIKNMEKLSDNAEKVLHIEFISATTDINIILSEIFLKDIYYFKYNVVDKNIITRFNALFGSSIKPGVIESEQFNLYIVYDESPFLTVHPGYNVIVVGDSMPKIAASPDCSYRFTIRCFGHSRVYVKADAYVEVYYGAYAYGEAACVSVDDDLYSRFPIKTPVIRTYKPVSE